MSGIVGVVRCRPESDDDNDVSAERTKGGDLRHAADLAGAAEGGHRAGEAATQGLVDGSRLAAEDEIARPVGAASAGFRSYADDERIQKAARLVRETSFAMPV